LPEASHGNTGFEPILIVWGCVRHVVPRMCPALYYETTRPVSTAIKECVSCGQLSAKPVSLYLLKVLK